MVKICARKDFYRQTLKEWVIDKNSSVLVVAGDDLDKSTLINVGIKNATITNINNKIIEKSFYPYKWEYQNAECLTYPDCSFDYVIIHAALHHCYSPHKALNELYRVARKSVIAIESRESLVIRISLALQLTYQYELPAVKFSSNYENSKCGGVAGTEIPNFIYRWNEREIEKTINCFAPYSNHKFFYKYAFATPGGVPKGYFSSYKFLIFKTFALLIGFLFPKQMNLFAFNIIKPDLSKELFPWLKYDKDKIRLNSKWLNKNWKLRKVPK